MEITQTLYVADREAWRTWLDKNHVQSTEIWLVYFKKHTGRASILYDDAVEEAICFGWIDGLEKSIDEEKFAQRFTPRRPRSNWSESNLKRARRMIKEGKMAPAGMAALKRASGR